MSEAEQTYAFGPFVLDVANRRLSRDGEPVAITARVFDILVALVERQGQPVEKDALIAQVWGNVAVEEGNLARHVSTLRKVLGEAPDNHRYIVTLPGRGYQFVAAVSTPEEEPVPSPARPERDTLPHKRRMWALAAAVMTLVICAYFVKPVVSPIASSATMPRIAVLPFKNLGPVPEDYVAAGITEEITSRLASVGSLRVVSRTSAAHLERSGKTTPEIAADLGADYLLEGSVLWDRPARPTERVRITAQLIRASDDSHVWTETFDRDVADLFTVQSEIAVRVVREMRSTLVAADTITPKPPTSNPEAYRAYLQGRFYASRPDYSEEGRAAPIVHFQRAADLDSTFAHAHAALAQAHALFFQFGHDASANRLDLARRALDRATALAPDLPETSRARIQYGLATGADTNAILASIAHIEQGRPNEASLFIDSSRTFLQLGRWAEAADRLTRARDLDPRNPFVHAQLGLVLIGLRRYADAQQALEQSLAIERDQQLAYILRVWTAWLSKGDLPSSRAFLDRMPQPDDWRFMELRFLQALYERRFDLAVDTTSPWADRWMRTWVLARPAVLLEAQAWRLGGDRRRAEAAFDASRSLLEAEVRTNPDDGRLRSSLGIAYAGLGLKADALREARRALELMPFATGFNTSVVREDVALIATMVGESDLAIRELQTLLSTPAHFSEQLLRLDPRWDPLRADARFQQLGRMVE